MPDSATITVPREPTEAMLTAAAGVGDEPDYLAAVWRAMVAAAMDEDMVAIPRLSNDRPR